MVNPKIDLSQVINNLVPQPQQGRMWMFYVHVRVSVVFLTTKSMNHLHLLRICMLCVGSGYHLSEMPLGAVY